MIEVELTIPPRTFYILVLEMRPATLSAVLDEAGWEFDAKTGEWRKGRLTLREVHTLEHEDYFPVVISGRESWLFFKTVLEQLGG